MTVDEFIILWSNSEPSERANAQLFLTQLCDQISVPPPDPRPGSGYHFEWSETEGRADLYKRGCLMLEAKQFRPATPVPTKLQRAADSIVGKKKKSSLPIRGTDAWHEAMVKARKQAEQYIHNLPATEPNPPFLIVVDVGGVFEIFADFTQAGRAYLPFPDPLGFRFELEDLHREDIRERLRLIWTDPSKLDPSLRAAEVTREVSSHLALLASSLESAGHTPKAVAEFLTRCLFCMFAEDVGLLPERSFTELLKSIPNDGSGFMPRLSQLFREMNTGTGKEVSIILLKKLLCFNGGLFADDTVLPVNSQQLTLLRNAASKDWKNVEPAIFGTLLERALNPTERHQLGSHFTPRAYVERLVMPTVIEPLRAEWENVRTAAVIHARSGNSGKAISELRDFHHHLCSVRVLDPACGSGNFLYVTLEFMKRLEGEVLDELQRFGDKELTLEMQHFAVDPHQFLGLEVTPRAVAITELVLWIGYLQWHFRTRGKTMPSEPVLKKFLNIECRDAVLAYDGNPQPKRDDNGNIVTVWDRRSMKTDLVTGREVPDDSRRVPLLTYTNPRPAEWPAADYIVGNPPFIGATKMRGSLGDGYAETLRAVYPEVPESANFVMYWWHKAAEYVRAGKAKRFGLITTNALRQTFNCRVVQTQLDSKPPLSLVFAIPDHPWVDTTDGAAVRIAMTVGAAGKHSGELLKAVTEETQPDGSVKVTFATQHGRISHDLTLSSDAPHLTRLEANRDMSLRGMCLVGKGFMVTHAEATRLGLGTIDGIDKIIRPYINGKDVTQTTRGILAVDFFGFTADDARRSFPTAFQRVITRVKPERDLNPRKSRRLNWWLFGETNPKFRSAASGLTRYVATSMTAKHRTFTFLTVDSIPDQGLIAFPLEDAFFLGVLSSHIHIVFTLAEGGTLEDRPRYNNSRCFDPFPFPICGEAEKERIRKLAEELDAHRKRVQAQHAGLTLTAMYNVLEKLRANKPLTSKDKQIHEAGLVSVLRQLHDDLDAAVSAAYGWPATLTDAEIKDRLVTLNAKRAREESEGVIHWLRPEYQARNQTKAGSIQKQLAMTESTKPKRTAKKPAAKQPWPQPLAERVKAVEAAVCSGSPVSAEQLSKQFQRAKAAEVADILETLVALGRVQHGHAKGEYVI